MAAAPEPGGTPHEPLHLEPHLRPQPGETLLSPGGGGHGEAGGPAGGPHGLAPHHPHKLRHSYASALVEAGRGIDEVKELLGHSSISTTQIYVHVSRKRLEEAAKALPDVLG